MLFYDSLQGRAFLRGSPGRTLREVTCDRTAADATKHGRTPTSWTSGQLDFLVYSITLGIHCHLLRFGTTGPDVLAPT